MVRPVSSLTSTGASGGQRGALAQVLRGGAQALQHHSEGIHPGFLGAPLSPLLPHNATRRATPLPTYANLMPPRRLPTDTRAMIAPLLSTCSPPPTPQCARRRHPTATLHTLFS